MNAERPAVFSCDEDQLVGILHPGSTVGETGVVIVVGGPQYRVGSHRQFVIMARQFAAAGFPVLRFDYRGMGDADGEPRGFDRIDTDIEAAVNCLTSELPQIKRVILLGLCDAASANLMYASRDQRVRGLILLNPWVRTEQGEARSYLRHYYLRRFLQKAFWRKVISGEFNARRAVRELLRTRQLARGSSAPEDTAMLQASHSFIERMLAGLRQFNWPVLFLISGRDLTAQEFMDLCRDHDGFRNAVAGEHRDFVTLPEADHTHSMRRDLDQATARAIDWIVNIKADTSAGSH